MIANEPNNRDNELEIPLPYDENTEFLKIGFNDMCHYLQNDNFHQYMEIDYYQLPMPLFLDNSNDFYSDAIIKQQLTDEEISFMKKLESFEDDRNNDNPFDIDMTRMDNLFKIADFLQMERLLTIIAARQASLMTNMNEQQMIKWLLEDHNTKKPMMINNSDKYNECENERMIPLFSKTHSSTNYHDNNNKECANSESADTLNINTINEINKYNWVRLTYIVPFLSCHDIHTFSSISREFYKFANELKAVKSNIDPMIKILANNNDSPCLLLTNQELLFYKPFLTLPQHKWSESQNNTYDQLKQMTNSTINVESKYSFNFKTIVSLGDRYKLHMLECRISSVDNSIEIYTRITADEHFGSISFKFGKFAQKLNIFAQSKNIEHIKMRIYYLRYLSSFNDLVGINDINNIKSIQIMEHSFAFINFEQIYNISSQIEYLEITTNINKARSINNMHFLSKLESLKGLWLTRNNLDSFNFDVLNGLRHLKILFIQSNQLDYKLDAQCLDFAFLHNTPNLKTVHLKNNQIECVINFGAIQTHSNLVWLDLERNKISSLDLNVFQGTNLQRIDLSKNKLSSTGFSHDDNTSQVQSCLDFNSFNKMKQLQSLRLDFNQIECVSNFELIQQHTQLKELYLNGNHLVTSLIDFTKFDESKPSMISLHGIYFNNMNLKYTMQNNNCLDLQFLKFMPNIEDADFSYNKIECVDNISILQKENVTLEYLYFDNNNLLSFDFADLIGSNIGEIYLMSNNLSRESLQNFDVDTLLQINPSGEVIIYIVQGNDDRLKAADIEHVSIY